MRQPDAGEPVLPTTRRGPLSKNIRAKESLSFRGRLNEARPASWQASAIVQT
jgi:hypothetical protein